MDKAMAIRNQAEDTQMKPTGLSPDNDAGLLHPRATLDRHKSHTQFLQLIHFQQLNLFVEQKGADVESVSGPFDSVCWDDLNLVQRAIQQALVKTEIFTANAIRTELALIHQLNNKWDLVYTLWLDSPTVDPVKLQRGKSIGTAVLAALGPNQNNPTASFCFDLLTDADRDVVHEVAVEELRKSGGHLMKQPISVIIDKEIQMTLCGKLGAKPNQSNFDWEAAELIGKFRGFMNDHKEHVLFFNQPGKGNVEIGFLAWQLEKQIICLAHIELLNRNHIECIVQTKKTTDATGKSVHQFVSMEVLKAAGPVPDLFTPEAPPNKNNATEASRTHSNES